MTNRLEPIVDRQDERILLRSPEVGTFTRALRRGAVLTPGASCGVIHRLDVAFTLVVPAGVTGRVVSPRPERVNAPVDHGALLYELAPLVAEGDEAIEEEHGDAGGAIALRAPYSGRFWQRPSPKDPPFVEEGDVLEPGRTVGLIEVMKTFTHMAYEPGESLPARARITRLVATDGCEVNEGDPLFELEPA